MAQRPPPSSQTPPGARRVSAATGPDAARPVAKVAPVESASQVGHVAATAPISPAAPISPITEAAPAAAPDRVKSIADRLRRGVLSPGQAVEELVEDAVARNLPGVEADSPLLKELRALLMAYAQDDPYLASRINRLGIQR